MTTVGLSSAAVISLSWLIESIIKEIDDEDALHPSSIFFSSSRTSLCWCYMYCLRILFLCPFLQFFAVQFEEVISQNLADDKQFISLNGFLLEHLVDICSATLQGVCKPYHRMSTLLELFPYQLSYSQVGFFHGQQIIVAFSHCSVLFVCVIFIFSTLQR